MRAPLELLALAVTGALHLAWPETGLSRAFLVVPLVSAWVAYLALRWRSSPETVRAWGLRWQGLPQTAAACMALLALTGPLMVAWGVWHGAEVPWTTWLTLLVYPLWGLVQQLLVQGLITRNLAAVAPGWVAALGSATVFGLVHWNEPVLVAATFLLGLVFAPLWLRYRNLWALGVAHGWLGTLVYTFVLMRDPLAAYLC